MKIKKRQIINVIVLIIVSVFSIVIGATAYTTSAGNVSYGNTTLNVALNELITKAINIKEPVTCTPGHYCTTSTSCPSGALCSKAKIGDYVSMTPTLSSYTVPMGATGYIKDQTIKPSELNLWRIIDIRSDGTIEMVSEYVSNQYITFQGRPGYSKIVGTLNLIAKQYENIKYTIGSRHMGYHGQTPVIYESYLPDTPSIKVNTSDNSNESVGGGDIMHTYDTDSSTGLVYKALGTLVAKSPSGSNTSYWLTSRQYKYTSTTTYRIYGRRVDTSGAVSINGGLFSGWDSQAIRPIVTLRADVTTSSGSGTSALPWVLS